MNSGQRLVLVKALFVLAAIMGALCVYAIVIGQVDALFDEILWATIIAPTSLVAALFLRAGGQDE